MSRVVLAPFRVASSAVAGGHFWVYAQYADALRRLGCDVWWPRGAGERGRWSDRVAGGNSARQASAAGPGGTRHPLPVARPWRRRAGPDVPDRPRRPGRAGTPSCWSTSTTRWPPACSPASAVRPWSTSTPASCSSGGERAAPGRRHDVYFSRGRRSEPYLASRRRSGFAADRLSRSTCGLYRYDPGCSALPSPRGGWNWVLLNGSWFDTCSPAAYLGFVDLPQPGLAADGDLQPARARRATAGCWSTTPGRSGTLARSRVTRARTRLTSRARAEFGCAKPAYVVLGNAWVSDRTACYLASGKPAVVQYRSPSDYLPDGQV